LELPQDFAMTSLELARFAKSRVGRFLADQRGATAIEYGLMVSLIGIAIMTIVFTTGQNINNTLYGRITNALAAMF
jgi:pilus assembly protein Flp/PilA